MHGVIIAESEQVIGRNIEFPAQHGNLFNAGCAVTGSVTAYGGGG